MIRSEINLKYCEYENQIILNKRYNKRERRKKKKTPATPN